MKLRTRITLYATALTVHLLALVAAAVLVAWPALREVDRTLAPLQEVFLEIAERQTRLVNQLSALEAEIRRPPWEAHLHGGQRPRRGAERSLISRYAQLLEPHGVRAVAELEHTFSRLEIAIAEALALHELGEQEAAETLLREIDSERSTLLEESVVAQAVVLDQGIMARAGFSRALMRLQVLGVAWLVSWLALVGFIIYDIKRKIVRPIDALDAGVERIGHGDWTHPVPVVRRDELGALAERFNELADVLRRRAGQHAQLVTAGELLAGVAHELNNPLQAIRGTAELNVDTPDASADDWHDVLVQSRRASKLVKDLLRFVQPRRRGPQDVDVNAVVRDALDLVVFQFRADGIAVRMNLQDDAPPVRVDPDELVGVFVNIFGNAHRVLRLHPGERALEITTQSDGEHVYTTVRDTGPGMPNDVRARLFDPFFTTREGGIGLGLAVSRDAVRRVGGDIHLDDVTIGTGASFTIKLPVATGTGLPDFGTEAPALGHEFDGVSILVVDDEEPIRRVLARYLEMLGADVEMAGGGAAAVRALDERVFDIVILDLRMPDLDGLTVYRTIAHRHPDLADRTIFLSGDISQLGAGLDVPASRILLKPVELDRLRGAVADVLDRAWRVV